MLIKLLTFMLTKLKGLTSYPVSASPTTVLGYTSGDYLRYESLTGGEVWVKHSHWVRERPIQMFGQEYAVTHHQHKSKFGFLLQKPWCFHIWFFWRPQKLGQYGEGISNTEQGIYRRIGLWRWDVAGTKGRHWIGPGTFYLNLSLHWD